MTREPRDPQPLRCSTVTERLIGGERPGADPQLSEHVGSCLLCFRTASDLRGLPTLRRQLSDAAEKAPDPGPAFWDAFPAQVAAAWESKQAALAPAQTPPVAEAGRGWNGLGDKLRARGEEFLAWLRMPVPAALGGALCAAAIIVAVTQTGGEQPGRASVVADRESASVAANAAAANASVATGLGSGPGSLMPEGAMDDSLKDLDVGELWRLSAGLEKSLADDASKRPGTAEADEPAGSNAAALVDELDELNDAGLAVLAQNLEGTI